MVDPTILRYAQAARQIIYGAKIYGMIPYPTTERDKTMSDSGVIQMPVCPSAISNSFMSPYLTMD